VPLPLPDWTTLAVALPTLSVSYIIFALAGFGAALLAAPILAHVMPVAGVVPLLTLLDCASASFTGFKLNAKIDRSELFRLIPLMVIGSVTGIKLLLSLPAQAMMLALGIFVVAFAIYGLLAPAASGQVSRWWVLPIGLVGGVFSGMFGSGGPIYAAYLSRRLTDVDTYRATQLTLIGLATFTRATIFLVAGVYTDLSLVILAIALVPAMALGTLIAHRITMKLSRQQFLRVLYIVLISSGGSLIVRAIGAS
jgi:uncharacterized membrane protein YfcA